MRNMSFSWTQDQIRNGTKTVTRRLGWWNLRPRQYVMAVVQCQGLPAGSKVEKIRPIKIVSLRKEHLEDIAAEIEGICAMEKLS